MLLSVVIVNYNDARWLPGCLETLAAQTASLHHEVILVDNASSDGSVELVRRDFPYVRVVGSDKNLGCAAGNNRGIAEARGRYILLLNSDTRFLAGLDKMVQFMEERPQVAALAPSMLDGAERPRASWGHFPTPANLATAMLLLDRAPLVKQWARPLVVYPEHPRYSATARRVDWGSTACLLTRASALTRVGEYDEYYFIYGDDMDWCYRAALAGYEVWFTPEARIVHYGAGGAEWRRWKGPNATVRWYVHTLHFYDKFFSPGQKLIARLLMFVGALIRWVLSWGLRAKTRGAERDRARQVTTAYANVLRVALASGRTGTIP